MTTLSVSAHSLVQKHSPRILKRCITERGLSDDEWKSQDAIRVICRFRPSNKRELAYSVNEDVADTPPVWQSAQAVILKRPHTDKSKSRSANKPYKCVLDSILQPTKTQKEVFYLIGQPMILQVLDGFNSTVFAYGQSGSGKTYTMFGPEDDTTNVEQFGLIPRCFIYLFQKLNESLSNNGGNLQDYKVSMELLQIYKSDLLDLLSPKSNSKKGKQLVIKTDFSNDSIFVQNLRKVDISTVEEAFACLTEAQSNRIVAGHALNAVSSRSHMLVIVNIMQRAIDGTIKRSKLNFGDLAGSEDLTKALGKNPDPERRKEAIAINSSLSALTTAMSFLSKGKKPGYRDSPLTHILKDSLGGNSKTIMFVACSPHIFNRSETIRALRFAATAKKVKNKAKKNEEQSTAAMKKRIKELELQVASLQAQLIEARGQKNVFKKKLQKQVGGKDVNQTSVARKLPNISDNQTSVVNISRKWSGSDSGSLVFSDDDDEEEDYLYEISQLRKKLDESLESNSLLNEEINAKNMELEQCNNQIHSLNAKMLNSAASQNVVEFTKNVALHQLEDVSDADGEENMLDYLMKLQANDRVRRNTIDTLEKSINVKLKSRPSNACSAKSVNREKEKKNLETYNVENAILREEVIAGNIRIEELEKDQAAVNDNRESDVTRYVNNVHQTEDNEHETTQNQSKCSVSGFFSAYLSAFS